MLHTAWEGRSSALEKTELRQLRSLPWKRLMAASSAHFYWPCRPVCPRQDSSLSQTAIQRSALERSLDHVTGLLSAPSMSKLFLLYSSEPNYAHLCWVWPVEYKGSSQSTGSLSLCPPWEQHHGLPPGPRAYPSFSLSYVLHTLIQHTHSTLHTSTHCRHYWLLISSHLILCL